jgi:hypothetical protein
MEDQKMQAIGTKYVSPSNVKGSRITARASGSSETAHQDQPKHAGEASLRIRIATPLLPAIALMLLVVSTNPAASTAQENRFVDLNPQPTHIAVHPGDRSRVMNPSASGEIAEAHSAGIGLFKGAGRLSVPAAANPQAGPNGPIGSQDDPPCPCACAVPPAPPAAPGPSGLPAPPGPTPPRHAVSCFWLDGQAANRPLASGPGKPTLSLVMNSQLYLAGIQKINPALAAHFFDTSRAILFTTNSNVNPVPAGWRSTGGMKFSSFALFSAAVAGGTIDRHVSLVIYDNEKYN